MTFDEHWKDSWASSRMPAVFDLAMMELAKKSWDAAMREAERMGEVRLFEYNRGEKK